MSREAVERTIKRVREQFERVHGRAPSSEQTRKIEQQVKQAAENADKKGSK